jgi:hypothetical protein
MHMARGGDAQGGRGDARASCASPLGTPLPTVIALIGENILPMLKNQDSYGTIQTWRQKPNPSHESL